MTLLWAWVVMGIVAVSVHHMGVEVPFDEVPLLGMGSMVKQHDDHHKLFHVNFGVTGVLDALYGTAGAAPAPAR